MTFCLINELSKSLTEPGSRLQFEMGHLDEGTIRFRCTPELGAIPANASEEEVQIRIALSQPLIVSGTPQQVAAGLDHYLGQHRQLVEDGIASISAMREKLNAAQVGASKAVASSKESRTESPTQTAQKASATDDSDAADNQAPSLESF